MKKFYLIALVGMLGTATVFGQTPYKHYQIPNKLPIDNYELSINQNINKPEVYNTLRKTAGDTIFYWVNYADAVYEVEADNNQYGSKILWPDSLLKIYFSNGSSEFWGTFGGQFHSVAYTFDPVSNYINQAFGTLASSYNTFLFDSLSILYTYDRYKKTFAIIDTLLKIDYYAFNFTVDGDTINNKIKLSNTPTYTYQERINKDTTLGFAYYAFNFTVDSDTVNKIIFSLDTTFAYSIDTAIQETLKIGTNKKFSIIEFDYTSNNPTSIIKTTFGWDTLNYYLNKVALSDTLSTLKSSNITTYILDSLQIDTITSINTAYDTTMHDTIKVTNYNYQTPDPTSIKDVTFYWKVNNYYMDTAGTIIDSIITSYSTLSIDSVAINVIDKINILEGPIDTLKIYIFNKSSITEPGYVFVDDEDNSLGYLYKKLDYDLNSNKPSGSGIEEYIIPLDSSYVTPSGQFGTLPVPLKKRLVLNGGDFIGAAFIFKPGYKYSLGDTLYDGSQTNPDDVYKQNIFTVGTYEEIIGSYPVAWKKDLVYPSDEINLTTGDVITVPGFSQNKNYVLEKYSKYSIWNKVFSDPQSVDYVSFLNGGYYDYFGYANMFEDPAPFEDEHLMVYWNYAPIGAFFDYAVNGCVAEFVASSNTGVDKWTWAFGDGGSSLTQSPTYTYPSKKTTYKVCLSGTNSSTGKKYTACKNIEVGFCTGIEDVDISNMVNIHPNPTNGLINIEFNLDAIENIKTEVYNLIGEKIVETLYENVSISKNQLDLSQNPAGVYFIKLSTGDRSTVKKVTLVK